MIFPKAILGVAVLICTRSIFGQCDIKIRDDYFLMGAGIQKSICFSGVCKSIPMCFDNEFVGILSRMTEKGCFTDSNVKSVVEGVLSVDKIIDLSIDVKGNARRVSVVYLTSDSLSRPEVGVVDVRFIGDKVLSNKTSKTLVICDSCRVVLDRSWSKCRDSILGGNTSLNSYCIPAKTSK